MQLKQKLIVNPPPQKNWKKQPIYKKLQISDN